MMQAWLDIFDQRLTCGAEASKNDNLVVLTSDAHPTQSKADQGRAANLMRADLTSMERDEYMARRKELYLEKHPGTKIGGAPGMAGGGKKAKNDNTVVLGQNAEPVDTPLLFVQDTAQKIGADRRTIER